MKIKPQALSERHIGMLCVVRFFTEGRGFIGHSQASGLQEGGVYTSYILVGELNDIKDDELIFVNYHKSKHTSDLSFSLGPRYSSDNGPCVVRRDQLPNKGKYSFIVLNHLPSSNAVMQHLMKSNTSKFWNCEHRLAEMLKSSQF